MKRNACILQPNSTRLTVRFGVKLKELQYLRAKSKKAAKLKNTTE